MTRTYNDQIRCPKCGYEHTTETDFERWMRHEPTLDSIRQSIVRFDLDVLLHQYRTPIDGKGSRHLQNMMFIEVKTRLARPTDSQRDTLWLLDQLLRNRQPNIHSSPRRQIQQQLRRAHSWILKREIALRLYGGHLLQMDGTSPMNSSKIFWDKRPITIENLIEILRFERDADRPTILIDYRRRSERWSQRPFLPGFNI